VVWARLRGIAQPVETLRPYPGCGLIDEQVLEDLRVEFRLCRSPGKAHVVWRVESEIERRERKGYPKSYEVEVALGVVVQADIATERFADVDVTAGQNGVACRAVSGACWCWNVNQKEDIRVEYPKARGRLRPGLSEKAFCTLEEVIVG
jgi:hypothetical protein